MKSWLPGLFVISLGILLLLPVASAHVPHSSGNNESLATATHVENPTKSWVIYTELHEGGEAQYYEFNISQGQRVSLMLIVPVEVADAGFVPNLALIGTSLDPQGVPPGYLETPTGAEVMVVQGNIPSEATYEGFSPSVFYDVAEISVDNPSPGTYCAAVFDNDTGGKYALVVGYVESYDLVEFVSIPQVVLSVYAWEGQGPVEVFAPLILVFIAALVLIIWRTKSKGASMNTFSIILSVAGGLFLGTSAMLFYQTAYSAGRSNVSWEVSITLIFAFVQLIIGLIAVRSAMRTTGIVERKRRVYAAIVGVVALFVWAGLYMGPILAIVAAILPKVVTDKTIIGGTGKTAK